MTATVASTHWLAAGAGGESGGWRFGRALGADEGDGLHAPRVQWALPRNCSLAPRQLFAVYLSICVLSLAIASAFGALGATPVLVYAGIELLVFGIALLVYARHAGDREVITLQDGALDVEHCCGARTERTSFQAGSVRVEAPQDRRDLLSLAGQGREVQVGRYLRPELRGALAQELRRALRAA